MRNLRQYPINSGEVIDALQTAREDFKTKHEGIIGNTNCLCLTYAEEFIRANKDAFDAFVNKDLK